MMMTIDKCTGKVILLKKLTSSTANLALILLEESILLGDQNEQMVNGTQLTYLEEKKKRQDLNRSNPCK